MINFEPDHLLRHTLSFCILICAILFSAAIYADEFQSAIVKTALHEPGVAPQPLTTIDAPRVRMVSFTTDSWYKTTDHQLIETIWATVEPELKQLCKQYVKTHPHINHQQLANWIARVLGLSLDQAEARRFVILEVPVIQAYYGEPANTIGIFRPCTDPRIGTHGDGSVICPQTMNEHDALISTVFKTWFINNSIAAYSLKKKPDGAEPTSAPWTEYGYTYNWNPDADTVFGVTEFVILKNSPVKILANPDDMNTAYVGAEQYCGPR